MLSRGRKSDRLYRKIRCVITMPRRVCLKKKWRACESMTVFNPKFLFQQLCNYYFFLCTHSAFIPLSDEPSHNISYVHTLPLFLSVMNLHTIFLMYTLCLYSSQWWTFTQYFLCTHSAFIPLSDEPSHNISYVHTLPLFLSVMNLHTYISAFDNLPMYRSHTYLWLLQQNMQLKNSTNLPSSDNSH